jgi:hypothetical protein
MKTNSIRKKSVRKKVFVPQLSLPHMPESKGPICQMCLTGNRLEHRLNGDDLPYYRCLHCGFESEPLVQVKG